MLIFQYKPGVGTVSGPQLERTISNPNYADDGFDEFGFAIAATNNYVIAGAPAEYVSTQWGEGVAFIHNPNNGNLLQTLVNPSPGDASMDSFGNAVGINNTYCIVGAPEKKDEVDNVTRAGQAYIFNTTTGGLVHTLVNPNNRAVGSKEDDQFGYSVDISSGNSYAIVGARHTEYDDDSTIKEESGAAYIYNASTGALLHTLENPNDYGDWTSDNFGRGVAINETYAVVGATGEDSATANGVGRVYVYNASTGALLHTISPPDLTDDRSFGHNVAINDNNQIVIGAPRSGGINPSDPTKLDSGRAFLYSAVTGNLIYTFNHPATPPFDLAMNEFGKRVAITNTRVAVCSQRASTDYAYPSPYGALWLHEPGFTNLTNLSARTYYGFHYLYNTVLGSSGIGSGINTDGYNELVMKDFLNDKYYTVEITYWQQGGGGGFTYTRQQVDGTTGANIGSPVVFAHTQANGLIDEIDTGLHINRGDDQWLFNPLNETAGSLRQGEVEPNLTGIVYLYNTSSGALEETIANPLTPTSNYDGEFGSRGLALNDNYIIGSAGTEALLVVTVD